MGGVTNGDLRYTLGWKVREGDAGHPMLALYAARRGLVVGLRSSCHPAPVFEMRSGSWSGSDASYTEASENPDAGICACVWWDEHPDRRCAGDDAEGRVDRVRMIATLEGTKVRNFLFSVVAVLTLAASSAAQELPDVERFGP